MTQTNTATVTTLTVDPEIAARAQAILRQRRKKTMSVGSETRLCAVIATLPRGVKVQDVAPMFGLTPSTLSRLRGLAFRGQSTFPAELRPALERSFVPRTPAEEAAEVEAEAAQGDTPSVDTAA